MANINFEYRSPKDAANLSLRLTHKVNDKFVSVRSQIEYEVERSFWNDFKKGTNFRDVDKANRKADLQAHLKAIEKHVLTAYKGAKIINSEWLKETIESYYNPAETAVIPTSLLGYFDYYLNLRKADLTRNISNWKKYNSIRNMLQRFEESLNRKLQIIDFNDDFANKWTEYGLKNNYGFSTIKKGFKFIKTVVRHAKTHGKIEVDSAFDTLQVKLKTTDTDKLEKIYLNFEELSKINSLTNLPDYLDNARDWLVISCYTGQRVSDFMRFTFDMIRERNGLLFIDFRQVKTGKDISVPILPEVKSILEKRNGEFPRAISDQRYNDYIKEVCRLAGIDDEMKGKVSKVLSNGEIRGVTGIYHKWELISSHVGRRSFATNYYGKVPTAYLKNVTGHATEAMLLQYIGKPDPAKEQDIYKSFIKAK